ncbi:hypothetical protein A2U01_0103714, partial [Trifolium medium]|nr:hypothetical protein [Trifolium medium]
MLTEAQAVHRSLIEDGPFINSVIKGNDNLNLIA